MREIVVISGKGGTGKTSITAAFAHLAQNKVICDLDVDAPDLHIIARPSIKRSLAFLSGHQAQIDPSLCSGCGKCHRMCRFDAIEAIPGAKGKLRYQVRPSRCEGCKVCVAFCPEKAIDFNERLCGTWHESQSRFGPMIHALLYPGQENSGKLVSLLKQKAKECAEQAGLDLILSDGSPGIGCPVISSLSRANLALMVTEPTPSGLHDLQRIVDLCLHFRIPGAVIINKADLSAEYREMIQDYCRTQKLSLIAEIPFDPSVTEAMLRREAVTEDPENHTGALLRQAWDKILAHLDQQP